MDSSLGPQQEFAASATVADEEMKIEAVQLTTEEIDVIKAVRGMTVGKDKDEESVSKEGGSYGGTEGKGKQLSPQLLNLLNTAKVGDSRALQKMTTAVKKFLHESNQKADEKRQGVLELLGNEGFLSPLLMKCLRSNVAKIPGLVSDSLWILNSILDVLESDGESGIKLKIDVIVQAGVIPLMVKLVNAQDSNYKLNTQAIVALEHFAIKGYRDELVPSGSGLLSALTKVAKKKNCGIKLQHMMVNIARMLIGQIRNKATTAIDLDLAEINLAGYKELMDNLPPLALVLDVIPLLNVLIDTKDNGVLGKTLTCLAFGSCVKGSFHPIIDSGILKKVCLLFNHSLEAIRFYAVTTVSSIASLTDAQAIIFLKSMKGSFGLKNFYLGLQSDNDALIWASDQFFSVAVTAINNTYDLTTLTTILSSGFIHALVQCLKPDTKMHEKHILGSVWTIGRISTEVPLSQRRIIVEAGALPFLVELLKSDNETIIAMAAVSIGNLVQERPLNRDLVVHFGVVPLLTDIIKREGNSLQGLISVLASLEMIADVRPPTSMEVMKDVPVVLMGVLDDKNIKFPDKLIPGIFSIIWKLCDSGPDGIDIIIQSGFLPRFKTGLVSGSIDTLAFTLEAIEVISRGTKEHRDAILNIGIVESLVDLLHHSATYVRKVAICALANLYKGQLTPERRECIQKMVPQVIIEMSNQDPRISHPAGLAFQNVISHFKHN